MHKMGMGNTVQVASDNRNQAIVQLFLKYGANSGRKEIRVNYGNAYM